MSNFKKYIEMTVAQRIAKDSGDEKGVYILKNEEPKGAKYIVYSNATGHPVRVGFGDDLKALERKYHAKLKRKK